VPHVLSCIITVKVVRATLWGPLRIVLLLVLWSVSATMRCLVVPLNARYWRECEFAADAEAARAGYADGLHQALTTIGRGFDGARDGWDQVMLASHPPIELRLERLEPPGRSYPVVQDASTGHVIVRPGTRPPRSPRNLCTHCPPRLLWARARARGCTSAPHYTADST